MMMRITITQQWLHPSDAGGAKRRGGQCQAASRQHVPHGDPGGPHSQQDEMKYYDDQDGFHGDLREACQKCLKVWSFTT